MEKLTREQLQELQEFDSPTICNAIETFNLRPNTSGFMKPGMIPRCPISKPMVGYAATAKVSAMNPATKLNSDMLYNLYESVRETQEPVIAVIQDIDPEPVGSFWGEVQVTSFMSLGAVGTLTDGGVRDLAEAEKLGFGYFSTSVLVSHAYIHVENYDCPVDVCGLTINPGDLLHADSHGVVCIPHEIAPRLAEACRKVAAAELAVLEPCRQAIASGIKPTGDQMREWRGEMIRRRKAVNIEEK